jgi:hypothetical protein
MDVSSCRRRSDSPPIWCAFIFSDPARSTRFTCPGTTHNTKSNQSAGHTWSSNRPHETHGIGHCLRTHTRGKGGRGRVTCQATVSHLPTSPPHPKTHGSPHTTPPLGAHLSPSNDPALALHVQRRHLDVHRENGVTAAAVLVHVGGTDGALILSHFGMVTPQWGTAYIPARAPCLLNGHLVTFPVM